VATYPQPVHRIKLFIHIFVHSLRGDFLSYLSRL